MYQVRRIHIGVHRAGFFSEGGFLPTGAAFSYAAPSIQSLFQTPTRFMEMVKRDYQPVYRPKSAKFLDLIQRQGEVVQKMFIIGPKGVLVNAFYIMERQKNNVWKIGGCVLVPLKGETI